MPWPAPTWSCCPAAPARAPATSPPAPPRALVRPGIVVHGVALKPGKPLCLAVQDGKPVAILPGFPTSAIFTFHAFVAPVIRAFAGRAPAPTETAEATLPLRIASERGAHRIRPVVPRPRPRRPAGLPHRQGLRRGHRLRCRGRVLRHSRRHGRPARRHPRHRPAHRRRNARRPHRDRQPLHRARPGDRVAGGRGPGRPVACGRQPGRARGRGPRVRATWPAST